jgi:LCP family protein required for cell wall assembly
VTLAVVFAGLFAYRSLEGNITSLDTSDVLGDDRPDKVVDEGEANEPLNILLLGSDTREGQSGNIGGESPGLSDTTILLHLSADRKNAYGVSLPRDAMVERPECITEDGQTIPGEMAMFNTAYALGGPGCTQRTVEQLTGIRVDHFVVVEFDGFRNMVDALGGIPICVPEEVNDYIGNIHLPAGSYEADGDQALDYVRLRHGLSENGDIGRMKRQQVFLATMANKAISAGTLANPVKLYNFLDAATKSLTTDPGLADLKALGGLANQVRNIGLDNIQFMTVPWESYEPDPNRLVWAPEAERLWRLLRTDQELSENLSSGVTTAAETPGADPDEGGGSSSPKPSKSADGEPSPSPEDEAEEAAEAAENGLCT